MKQNFVSGVVGVKQPIEKYRLTKCGRRLTKFYVKSTQQLIKVLDGFIDR